MNKIYPITFCSLLIFILVFCPSCTRYKLRNISQTGTIKGLKKVNCELQIKKLSIYSLSRKQWSSHPTKNMAVVVSGQIQAFYFGPNSKDFDLIRDSTFTLIRINKIKFNESDSSRIRSVIFSICNSNTNKSGVL